MRLVVEGVGVGVFDDVDADVVDVEDGEEEGASEPSLWALFPGFEN